MRSRAVFAGLVVLVAAKILLGCSHVTVRDDGTTTVRSFGAGSVTVLDDGTIETTSPGLSEGLSSTIGYALKAVATFFHVAPPEPAAVVVTPSCSE